MSKKLILGVTVGGSSRLLDGQANYFKELGYDVYLISQEHYKELIFCKKEGIQHLPIKDLVADIHPLKDIKALLEIVKYFRKVDPDIVNVGTPKIGLLGMLAANWLGVQKKIYTCRGLRYETEIGLKRAILLAMEKLTVSLADQVIYVSNSMYQNALRDGVADAKKAVLIPPGSSNGVNIEAFDQTKIDPLEKQKLMDKYQLIDKLVIGFIGRVTLHKGAYELVEAFEELYNANQNVRLIMMGHIKCDEAFEQRFSAHPGIIHIPFQDNVSLYMSLFDIFVLPSWREGFPNVPIQAAAMGLPIVISDATGCIDSVKHGFNGCIYKVKDSLALYETIKKYIVHPELREEHGRNGLTWAQNFTNEKIWNGIQKIYE
jgi:glycosyltransferase involved in cell wall biosynthesis